MSDQSADESTDSVEEIISMRPIPRSRVTANSLMSSSTDYDSALPSSATSTARTVRTPVVPISHSQVKSIPGPFLTRQISSTGSNVGIQSFPPIISLNVGGTIYMTRLSTLLKYSDSMLAAMFSGRHQVDQDSDGHYFLDSSGTTFGFILEYLRHGTLPPRSECLSVYRDANYYGLHDLVEQLSLRPEIITEVVKEAHRAQFPDYHAFKTEVIRLAVQKGTVSKSAEIIIHAFQKEIKSRTPNYNAKHSCIVESAHLCIGPWESAADEEIFIRCLEGDLIEDGFSLKIHDGKRKCKYYYGQTCPRFVYRIQFNFD